METKYELSLIERSESQFPTPGQVTEAVAFLDERRQRNFDQERDAYADFTDQELLYAYLFKGKRSVATNRKYFYDLMQFLETMQQILTSRNHPFVEDNLLRTMNQGEIEMYQKLLKRNTFGYRTNTINGKLTVVKGFLRFLSKENVTENFENCIELEVLTFEERAYRDLNLEQVQFILAHLYAAKRFDAYAFVLFASVTGLRANDIAKIQMKDMKKMRVVDGEYVVITVREEKSDQVREVVLHPRFLEPIFYSRKQHGWECDVENVNDESPLFVNSRGKAYLYYRKDGSPYNGFSNVVSNWLRPIAEEFPEKFTDRIYGKIDLTAHVFRHAYANYLYQYAGANAVNKERVGFSPSDISASLMHASVKTTQDHYLSNRQKRERDLGRFINPDDFLPPYHFAEIQENANEVLTTVKLFEALQFDNARVLRLLVEENVITPINLGTHRMDKTYLFNKVDIPAFIEAANTKPYYRKAHLSYLGYIPKNKAKSVFKGLGTAQVEHWIEQGMLNVEVVENENSSPNQFVKEEDVRQLVERRDSLNVLKELRPLQRVLFQNTAHRVLEVSEDGTLVCVPESVLYEEFPFSERKEDFQIDGIAALRDIQLKTTAKVPPKSYKVCKQWVELCFVLADKRKKTLEDYPAYAKEPTARLWRAIYPFLDACHTQIAPNQLTVQLSETEEEVQLHIRFPIGLIQIDPVLANEMVYLFTSFDALKRSQVEKMEDGLSFTSTLESVLLLFDKKLLKSIEEKAKKESLTREEYLQRVIETVERGSQKS